MPIPPIAASSPLAPTRAMPVCSGLPPLTAPKLNPIERVWKLARRLCLHNRCFGFLERAVALSCGVSAQECSTPSSSNHRHTGVADDAKPSQINSDLRFHQSY